MTSPVMFWDRDSQPIDWVIDWAMRFESPEERIVACDQDAPGEPMVSTVWHGLDLAHGTASDPMIFETAYLVDNGVGSGEVTERWLAATESEALAVHAKVCREKLGREPAPDGGLRDEIIRKEQGLD